MRGCPSKTQSQRRCISLAMRYEESELAQRHVILHLFRGCTVVTLLNDCTSRAVGAWREASLWATQMWECTQTPGGECSAKNWINSAQYVQRWYTTLSLWQPSWQAKHDSGTFTLGETSRCTLYHRPYLSESEEDAFINIKLSAIRQAFEVSNPLTSHLSARDT